MDSTDPAGPVVVHGFLPRHAAGVEVVATWDAQGMRATESHDTVLDGAFVSDADVLAVVPAGPSDDPAVGAMAVWALTLISNVYVGIAERAMEIAIEHCHRATSIAIPAGTVAHHPLVQARIADMHLELAAARAQLDRLATDWVEGVDHGPAWPIHVFAAKWRSTTAAIRVVDLACDVVGGASFRRGHELERLSRDVARRPLPPRHRCVHPRGDRQGAPRHRPHRPPLVTPRCTRHHMSSESRPRSAALHPAPRRHPVRGPTPGSSSRWTGTSIGASAPASRPSLPTCHPSSSSSARGRARRCGTSRVGADSSPSNRTGASHGALRRSARREIDLEIRVERAESIGLETASVDAVICTLVLCTVEDQSAVLAEVRRILRPGGRFLFIEHVRAGPGLLRTLQRLLRRPWRFVFDGCCLDRDTAATIADAGFADVRIEPYRFGGLFVPVWPQISGVAVA